VDVRLEPRNPKESLWRNNDRSLEVCPRELQNVNSPASGKLRSKSVCNIKVFGNVTGPKIDSSSAKSIKTSGKEAVTK